MESVDKHIQSKEVEKQKSLLVVDSKKVLDQIDEDTRKLFTKNTGDSDFDKQRTDTFLRDLVDGVVNTINLTRQEDYDTIFFLDKSARPLEQLFSRTWEAVFPGENKPQIRFLNNFSKSELPEGVYPTEAIEEFRNTFNKDVEDKKVLVVDEYISSGHSLGTAQEILHIAFVKSIPDITYTGVLKHSWVSWRVQGATGNKEDTQKRGIGVVDNGVPVVLHTDSGSVVKLDVTDNRSLISDPLASKVRTSGEKQLADNLQEQVNELRAGLGQIAKLIANNSTISSGGSFKVKPYLPYPSFEREFNGNRFN